MQNLDNLLNKIEELYKHYAPNQASNFIYTRLVSDFQLKRVNYSQSAAFSLTDSSNYIWAQFIPHSCKGIINVYIDSILLTGYIGSYPEIAKLL